MIANHGTLYASTQSGLFRSSNNGASWSHDTNWPQRSWIVDFAAIGSNLFAATDSFTWRSSNDGATWQSIANGLTPDAQYTHHLATSGTTLLVGTAGGGIYRTTNDGEQWVVADTDPYVYGLNSNGTDIFAGTARNALYSSDAGRKWIPRGLAKTFRATQFAWVGQNVFAASYSGLMMTTNNGRDWSDVTNGLTTRLDTEVTGIVASGNDLFASAINRGVFRTTDLGVTWTSMNTGLPSFVQDYDLKLLYVYNGYIFVRTDSGLYSSSDEGAHWTPSYRGMTNWDGVDVSTICSADGSIYVGTPSYGMYRSDDGGVVWNTIDNGLTHDFGYLPAINRIDTGDGFLWAATSRGLFRSADRAGTWLLDTGTGLGAYDISSIQSMDGALLVSSGGIYRSTDGGSHWGVFDTGMQSFRQVHQVAMGRVPNSAAMAWYAATDSGMYASSDSGQHWYSTYRSSDPRYISSIVTLDTIVIAATTNERGVFVSRDQGYSWRGASVYPSTNTVVTSLDGFLFSGTVGGGIFISTDSGGSWVTQNDGLGVLANSTATSFAPLGSTIFAGVSGYNSGAKNVGLWRRPIVQVAPWKGSVAQASASSDLPLYPNPASERITIVRSGMSGQRSEAVIYDLMGREVNRTTSESETITVDVHALVAGTYLCITQSDAGVHRTLFTVAR